MNESTLETGLEGIAYCCLPVADIFQTAEWYVKHFGFEIKFPRDNFRLSLWNNGRPILDLVKKDAETTATFTLNNKGLLLLEQKISKHYTTNLKVKAFQ